MFDRSFFTGSLQQIVGEYALHRRLSKVVVEIWTLDDRFTITGLRLIGNGVAFFSEDDRMHLLPFERIVKVEVRPPGPGSVGFALPLGGDQSELQEAAESGDLHTGTSQAP